MTRAITHTFSYTFIHRMQITAALLAVSLVMIIAYAVNIFSIISHTVALQSAEKQMRTLSVSVADLDTRYLDLSGSITPDSLKSHGFVEGKVSEYISSASAGRKVAMGGHEF